MKERIISTLKELLLATITMGTFIGLLMFEVYKVYC